MTDIDPPWRLDPLQTITDVHWSTPGFSATWESLNSFTGSGAFDCPLGPHAVGHSTISFSLAAPVAFPHPDFTLSDSPSISPTSYSSGAGVWSSMALRPESKTGTGPGTAVFTLLGLSCSATSPAIGEVGSFTVTIPAITLTEISTGDIYDLDGWSASASSGIIIGASFKLRV